LSALLLQVFYGIRSERQLMEQLDYNLFQFIAYLAKSVLGQADAARLGHTLQSRCDIDAVAEQVAIGLLHHIAKMNSDAKLNLFFRDEAPVAPRNAALDFQRTTHGVQNAGELD
jgi:hypothetical protein